ncbi:MAG: phage tail tape measure protein [Xanthomonadales bacterium]|nr:phage tail tape measure protein [Xanthomonadales bacterium]
MAGQSLRLQVILDALDRVSGPIRRIAQGSKGLSAQLKSTRQHLKQLETAQQSLGKHRELELQSARTSAELQAQRRKLDALHRAYSQADGATAKMTQELNRQTIAVGKLARVEESQRQALARSRTELQAAGYQVGKLGMHQRDLARDIDKANTQLAEQLSRLDRIGAAQRRNQRIHSAGMKASMHGAGMVAGGVVAARAALKPAQAFAEQESSAVQLRAASMQADGGVSKGYAQMLGLAQKLGNELPGTTAELIEMMTMLRRQGMSEATILGGLGQASAHLGAQLRMPYVEAAEFAAKLQDATRSTEGEMLALADTIQRTFYLGVESDNMLQGFSKLSPALQILRMRGAEAGKALAPLLVMADQAGMAGEQAGNAYRKVFQYSLDEDKLGKANALLKGTGVKLDFTDGKGEFAGLEAMYAQLAKLKGLNTQDRMAVLKKLYGDDAETLQVVSMMIDKGIGGYREVQAKMGAQASLQARVDSQLGTLSAVWEAATGTFTNVLATLGGAIAPELKALAAWAGNTAAGFQRWAEANPRLAKALGLIALAGTAAMVVLGGLLVAGGMAAMAFSQIHTALTLLSGGRGLGWLAGRGASLVPRFFGAIGRGAMGAMRVLAMTGGKIWQFAQFAGRGLARLGPIALRVGAMVGRALLGIGSTIARVGVMLLTNPIFLAFALLAGAAYLVWKNWDGMKAGAILLWQDISRAVVAAWELIRAKAGVVWDAVSGRIRAVVEGIRMYISGAWAVITGIFSGDGGRIRAGLQQMWNGINAVLGGWPARLLGIGRNVVQGLVNGITGMAGAVRDALGGIANGAVARLKSLLGIKSPSRVFAALGGHTMAGFTQGLLGGQGGAQRALQRIGTGLRVAGAGMALGATGAVAASPALQPRIDNRPPLAQAARGMAGGGDTHVYHITIHAAPGTDPQDLSRMLREELERLDRERSVRRRSKLSDYDSY